MTRNAAIVESLKPFGKSIYATMSALAKEHDAADLGQGYPDEEGPIRVRELAAKYLVEGPNQYTPPAGVPAFRSAIVTKTKECYGIDVDADSQIVVTAGAEEALTAAFIGLCEPGDEVVIVEPFYIPYLQKAAMVRATVRYVRPEGPHYKLSADLLRAQVSDKTKLIVINSPGNPSGHVVSREELQAVGEIAAECGAYVICDDAYEHLCFDGREHVHGMSVDSLKERVICISSFGKTFQATGWRLGYAVGPEELIWSILVPHNQLSFCLPGHLQLAAAEALSLGKAHYAELAAKYQARRDRLCDGLIAMGVPVYKPEGGFFAAMPGSAFGFDDDVEFCQALVKDARVATVPMSPCFAGKKAPTAQARLCFAKKASTIDLALERIETWKKSRA